MKLGSADSAGYLAPIQILPMTKTMTTNKPNPIDPNDPRATVRRVLPLFGVMVVVAILARIFMTPPVPRQETKSHDAGWRMRE